MRNVYQRIKDSLSGVVLRSVLRVQDCTGLEKLGSEYGGWIVPTDRLDCDSVCYCAGVGEDVSFDLELIRRFSCTVFAFDPTPRAKAYVERVVGNNSKYRFYDIGLWSSDSRLKFYGPQNPAHVSHSIRTFVLRDLLQNVKNICSVGHLQQINRRRTAMQGQRAWRQGEYQRLGEKTRARQFVQTLEDEFELSPRESRGIYDVVEEMFMKQRELGEGQLRYVAVAAEEGSGPPMSELKKVTVILTRDDPTDLEVEVQHGRGGVRRVQLLRMAEEAYDQGALLTQEDLGRILGVSPRTVRRDVAELMQQTPVKLCLRGIQRDIGRGISHKVWIVGLYLEWKTYSEIQRMTGHSLGSIKTYLNDFARVLMARERGIQSPEEIGYYIGRTGRLVREYLALIEKAEQDSQQRERLESLKEQAKYLEREKRGIGFKKKDSGMVWRLLA